MVLNATKLINPLCWLAHNHHLNGLIQAPEDAIMSMHSLSETLHKKQATLARNMHSLPIAKSMQTGNLFIVPIWLQIANWQNLKVTIKN